MLGDIASNEKYGIIIKKWRELFNITQSKLARELNIKQSVISDYENNRRKSPGISFLRKYCISLIRIGKDDKNEEYNSILKMLNIKDKKRKLIRGSFEKLKSNKELLDFFKAHQIILPKKESYFKNFLFFSDNVSSVLTSFPSYKLLKNLKSDEKTVFIFSNVKSGKIPLIILQIISKLNKMNMPKLVVFQSEKFKITNFTKKYARKNNISIMISKLNVDKLKDLLDKYLS